MGGTYEAHVAWLQLVHIGCTSNPLMGEPEPLCRTFYVPTHAMMLHGWGTPACQDIFTAVDSLSYKQWVKTAPHQQQRARKSARLTAPFGTGAAGSTPAGFLRFCPALHLKLFNRVANRLVPEAAPPIAQFFSIPNAARGTRNRSRT